MSKLKNLIQFSIRHLNIATVVYAKRRGIYLITLTLYSLCYYYYFSIHAFRNYN